MIHIRDISKTRPITHSASSNNASTLYKIVSSSLLYVCTSGGKQGGRPRGKQASSSLVEDLVGRMLGSASATSSLTNSVIA